MGKECRLRWAPDMALRWAVGFHDTSFSRPFSQASGNSQPGGSTCWAQRSWRLGGRSAKKQQRREQGSWRKRRRQKQRQNTRKSMVCTVSTTCKLMSVTLYSRNVCLIDENKSCSVSTLAGGTGDEGRRRWQNGCRPPSWESWLHTSGCFCVRAQTA